MSPLSLPARLLATAALAGLALSTGPVVTAEGQEAAADADAARPGVDVLRAFPRLRFQRPVFLSGAGDGSGRVFVVEQAGVIRVFENREDVARSEVFLDLRDRISRRGNEEGLLGLAFDPRFQDSGALYVHYSSSREDMHGIVARYWLSLEHEGRADPDSEEVILRIPQPYRNHNGGSIAFGPDGYLYIGLGDGGSANDPYGNGQDLSTWLGSILRIDVEREDGERAYGVPETNPFVDRAGAAPEIWAYGLRNPWRFSFDFATGELWAGDVGQNLWEEIDRIERGGNYGWRDYEASSVFTPDPELEASSHRRPVAEFGRADGISVTGGSVYRGRRFPELVGSYFYGDYFSGNLWRLRPGGGHGDAELVRRTGKSIASFGEDDEGELYLLSFDGGIYRIVASAEPERTFEDWPARLSGTGLFASTEKHEVATHVVPYEVNAPFWSDGATKERFLALPEGASMVARDEGAWELPPGSVLAKSFHGQQFGRPRRLETRLIRRTQGGWEAATYLWDDDQKDASLSVGGRQFELYGRGGVTTWHAPSASECSSCHVESAGFSLGLTTAQLNRPGAGGENQIDAWARAGLVRGPEGFESDAAPRFEDPHGSGDLATRARVWLDVNCAMCHFPQGPGNARIDLRFSRPLAETGLVNEEPSQGDLGVEEARILAPGDPERSLLWVRVRTLGDGRMPSVATHQVDEAGVALLREWIEDMGARVPDE